jgi:hypothetical protein
LLGQFHFDLPGYPRASHGGHSSLRLLHRGDY